VSTKNISVHLKATAAFLLTTSVPIVLSISSSFIRKSAWLYKLLFSGAFLINWITVSIPGRFDGNIDKDTGKVTIPYSTLFEPEAWAFAIWGVIYISEIILTLYSTAIGKPADLLKDVTIFWIAGNLFQSIWCLVFRPEFKSYMGFSALLLALGSASFGLAHNVLSEAITGYAGGYWDKERIGLILMRFPLALHTGWLAAASLLNLNGWAVLANTTPRFQTNVAFLSAILGSIVGGVLSVRSGDGWIALTVAWALQALANRTSRRIIPQISLNTKNQLSSLEGLLSKVLMVVAVISNFQPFLIQLLQK